MINEQLLRKINQRQIKSLEKDARLLEDIARQVWLRYYDTYDPKRYDRSINNYGQNAVNAIHSMPKVDFIGDKARMTVTFEDDYALHPSLFKNGEDGNVFTLIDRGWTAKKLENRIGERIEHYTHYDGFDYFKKVISEFNNRKKSNTVVKHVSSRPKRGGNDNDDEE